MTDDMKLRMSALDSAMRLPDSRNWGGVSTVAQGYSSGRTVDQIVADAHKIYAFLKPTTKRK